MDITNHEIIHFSYEYEKDSSFDLIALSPQANMLALIEKEIDTLPFNPCSKRLKIIQYNGNNNNSHYYCLPSELKEVSHVAFNEIGTEIMIKDKIKLTPETSQSLSDCVFSLKEKFRIQENDIPHSKKSKLEEYFNRKSICKELSLLSNSATLSL